MIFFSLFLLFLSSYIFSLVLKNCFFFLFVNSNAWGISLSCLNTAMEVRQFTEFCMKKINYCY